MDKVTGRTQPEDSVQSLAGGDGAPVLSTAGQRKLHDGFESSTSNFV
jgi:hypothetical protein